MRLLHTSFSILTVFAVALLESCVEARSLPDSGVVLSFGKTVVRPGDVLTPEGRGLSDFDPDTDKNQWLKIFRG
jgi:hypothetical protein